jgi:hypothetical protein
MICLLFDHGELEIVALSPKNLKPLMIKSDLFT